MIHRILNSVRKHDYLAVSLVLFATYFSIVLSFGYLESLSDTMFWSPDSRSYRAVGNWLFGIENTNATITRPFFYPLMLNLARSFASSYGIWCYQFLLWILSGVLLYYSIKTITNNIVLSVGVVFIFASNLTLLLLTLHALTEVTVTFLLTILIVLIINKRKYRDDHFWLLVIFIVSLLTVTKPVFIALLFAVLVYRIPVFILNIKKRKHKLRLLGYIILALCPVLIQLSIMEVKHNEFTISKIGALAVKNYYFAKVYGEVNDMSLDQAREHISSYDQKEMLEYLLTHYEASLDTYFWTLKDNFLAGSNFINHPNTYTHLSNYMKIINKVYFRLHVLMMLPSVILLIVLFKKKHWIDWEIIVCLMLPMYLIMLTSGITFWQGDRIILPSLPLWLVLYSVVLSRYWHLIKESRLTKRWCALKAIDW